MPAPELPFPPMEAELVRELPEGDGWAVRAEVGRVPRRAREPGGELALWSRSERPLLRYFPELRPLGELLPPRSALDGEIVIVRGGALDFDAMQMRLHPAESRIRRLSGEIPAEFVAFDVLVWEGEPVWQRPLEERRAELERLAKGFRLSPSTRDLAEARGWLDRFESLGLDGVVAKRLGAPYLPGSRDGVVKVKEHKTADCVVVGIRWKGSREEIATLLLGLYREDGEMDYVGSCAVAAQIAGRGRARRCCRSSTTTRLAHLRAEPLGHRASSRRPAFGPSWSSRCATTRFRATASATERS